MDLRDYLRAVRKRWWLVVGAVTVALGAGGLLTVQTPARYETVVVFFVNTPNAAVTDAYQGGLFSQQRVKSYATLLTSDRLAQAVARRNPDGLGAAAIRNRVAAAAQPETVLLRATVTDTDPDRSLLIAQDLAVEFKALIESLETSPGNTSSGVKVEVVAGPELNPEPVAPRPLRNLIVACLLGLLGGSAVAVLRELMDTTVKTSDELQQVAGAPVLAGVPFDGEAKSAPLLLIGSGGQSPRAEALRQLRTNLQFVDVDRPVKTLVVTSAIPGEGKSSTACNLSVLFAETGQRVLLVDADLRRPRIADYLGIEGAVGLTTVLAGRATVDDVLQSWGTGLWVMPSGFLPPNPSEMLGSRQMAEMLEHFRDSFDMVIVDCPPLLPVTDGAVVAARADGALLLTRSRKTTSHQVTAAANALKSVDARLLGCVLNMVPPDGADPYHYYYGRDASEDRRGQHRPEAAMPEPRYEGLAGVDAGVPVRSAR